jgi:hypothetical protein
MSNFVQPHDAGDVKICTLVCLFSAATLSKPRVSLFVNEALPQLWCELGAGGRGKTRARSSSNPARPYIWRLNVFSRLMD